VLSHTLFFHSSCDHRDLHSFPTRRSSDLQGDRGGEETRSSRAGTAARSLLHPGIGRTRPDLLASQRRNHSQGDGRLAALRVSEARILAGLHAARNAHGSVEDQRPHGLLRAEHVHTHGTRRCRVPAQANELSRAHPHLPEHAPFLSRPASASRRTWHGLSLRAFGSYARPAARAWFYSGRCPYFLHA